MAKKRIIVLGAGLAGLSAAWHLQRNGLDCQVFEKEKEVGGLCRSKVLKGFTFDLDGHLLHFKHNYTFSLVKHLLGNNLQMHQRNSSTYSFGRFIRYPFQANLYGLPLPVIQECLVDFIEASRNNHHADKGRMNFLCWIYKTFGKGIAKNFMIPYNAKFWTLPLERLNCNWFDGFIPVPSLNQVIEGTLQKSHEQLGYNVNFWYPKKGGINQLALSFARGIKKLNTGCPVTRIDLAKKEITVGLKGKEKFDYLICTAPMPELPSLMGAIPANIREAFSRLRWNSIFNLNLGLKKQGENGCHWVYFPEKDISFFRIGLPHNFSSSNSPPGKGSVYVEVSYSKDKPINKGGIVSTIKEDLKRVGIIKTANSLCCQDINDIKYGYPIYDLKYNSAVKAIHQFLANKGIIPCGRYGSWRYFSMEDAILDGKSSADSLH